MGEHLLRNIKIQKQSIGFSDSLAALPVYEGFSAS
jgi:hypothetical protein